MLFIDQAQYIKGVLSCYGMSGCTSISMPLPAKAQFQPATSEDHLEFSSYPYLEVIRSLVYAALGTCPNIAAVVHTLAPYATSFGKKHIDGVKHIMRYLSRCPSHGILYTRGGGGLVGYTDANWTNNVLNCRSISGYAFLYSGGDCILDVQTAKHHHYIINLLEIHSIHVFGCIYLE